MSSNKNHGLRRVNVRRRSLLRAAGGALALLSMSGHAATRERLRVVATFSILGDMVREIGGERVAVTTIVGPNNDAHRFEPTPQDAKAVHEAAVLVLNGLDFEAWLPRLLEAADFKGEQVLASQGVAVRRLDGGAHSHETHGDAHQHGSGHAHRHDAGHEHRHERGHGHAAETGGEDGAHDHGDTDPHAWQDLSNGMIYARNIAAGLSRADPRNASYYEGRAAGYVARMKTLDTEVKAAIAAIPPAHRKVVTSHDAFGYFGDAYGIEFIPIAGLSNQAEPSARDVAGIIRIARDEKVRGVFIENMSSPQLARQIARESGAIMGGTLYADALSPPDQPAATYLGMFSWNAGRLVYVLKAATDR